MLRKALSLFALATGVVFAYTSLAQAGCGCDKPPPELASVRPNATYAGTEVTLFHPSLQSGQSYDVIFTSGITGASATVSSQTVTRRDLGDGQYKPQLVVVLPNLPLGPTSIQVADQSGTLLALADDVFTVAPQPLAIPTAVGELSVPSYQAAVSRTGVVYLSLDVSAIQHPRTFQAQALGYPLRFTNNDVVFYNTQGFLMQLLDEGLPGLFAIDAASGSADSDTLQYSRHEFNTYFLQHDERQTHIVDPTDPNWHLDGAPHIDHDHLIVAIAGMLDDGSLPAPGATPPVELSVSAQTLFQHGTVGSNAVTMKGNSTIDSYHSQTGLTGAEGDVLSNGTVQLVYRATIEGDAHGAAFDLGNNTTVTGALISLTVPYEFLPVEIPADLEALGNVTLKGNDTLTLGPGSYHLSELQLTYHSKLYIENTDGPVTLYVDGLVEVKGSAKIITSDPNPEKFAIYVAGNQTVRFKYHGNVYGVVYAPESAVEVLGSAEFYGALVGQTVLTEYQAKVHYDTALRGE